MSFFQQMCSLYLYESVERAIMRAFHSHQDGKSYSTFQAAGVWSCCNVMIRSFISLLAEWALTDIYHTEISFVFGYQRSPSSTQFTQRSLLNNPKWSLLLRLISLDFWRPAASCHYRVSRPAWSDFKGVLIQIKSGPRKRDAHAIVLISLLQLPMLHRSESQRLGLSAESCGENHVFHWSCVWVL